MRHHAVTVCEHFLSSLRWLSDVRRLCYERFLNIVSDLAGEHWVERHGEPPRHAGLVITITHEEQTDRMRLRHYI